MKYLKLSLVFLAAGFIFIGLSKLTAEALPEAKHYGFPMSLVRHFAARKLGFANAVPSTTEVTLAGDDAKGADLVETVVIETAAIDITVERSHDQPIVAILKTQGAAKAREPLSIVRDGSTAIIRTAELDDAASKSGGLSFSLDGDTPSELRVSLPKTAKFVRVRTLSGDFKIRGIEESPLKLELESKSGDFSILANSETRADDVTGIESVRATTVSGNFRGETLGKVDLKSVSGDLELKNLEADATVTCRTVSGDCSLYYREAPSARLAFHSTSGDFKLDIADQPEIEMEKNQIMTLGKGAGALEISTVSGDLRIQTIK